MKATLTLNGKSIEVEISEEEAKKLMKTKEKKDSVGRVARDAPYYYVDNIWEVCSTYETDDRFDSARYEYENYFHTYEECQHKADRQKAIVKINRRIAELNDGWEET